MRLKDSSKQALKLTGIVLLSASLITTANAAKPKAPKGCRDMGYYFDGNLLVLQTGNDRQTLYMMHNISHDNIILEKTPKSRYLPPHKNTIISADWSAFAYAPKKAGFQFECFSSDYSEMAYPIDCSQVVSVCEYNNAKFAEHNRGTYWIGKSGSLRHTMRASIENGILLRS